MVCAESLSCGTPVIGFQAGAPEQISLENYSRFVEPRDIEQLTDAAKEMLNFKFDRMKLEKEAHRTYAKSTMAQKYIELYTELTQAERME